MKQKDVRVGMTCETIVGDRIVPVIVMTVMEPTRAGGHTRFEVRRINEAKPLPKWRTAAALTAVESLDNPEPTL